jgi:hypothetical protein
MRGGRHHAARPSNSYFAVGPQSINGMERAAIRNAIAIVRHLLQLFRLELQDPNARRKLRRLSQRLLTLSHVLDHIAHE